MFGAELKDILFLVAAVFIIAASIAAVLIRNPVRATFMLIASFLPTGFVYVLLQAPFIGTLQVLVYAGAILILFTFVIMMVNPGPGSFKKSDGESIPASPGFHFLRFLLFALPLALSGTILAYAISFGVSEDKIQTPDAAFGSLKSIGKLTFADALNNPLTLSFELLSLLVLAGIIIATNLSRGKSK